ncbi:MAG: methylisocitrate lyase [Candidatus Latescibacteria bacterium]|nr:methylisocitrate lyase [Candidatus Latescibacterota bacterium]
MLLRSPDPPVDKPRALRRLIAEGTVVMPGAFNAPVAMLAQQLGFAAVYISGAGLTNGLSGYPDIGLLGMDEIARQAGYIAQAVQVPAICDADTGYGEAMNVMRTVQAFEQAGLAGLHLEDQQAPKRCGHLEGKALISPAEMERKLAAAAQARRHPDFLLIARTDARAVEGLETSIERGLRYLEAGADAIFPEALQTPEEFGRYAEAVKAPLLANMTEFGKTPYLTVAQFAALGYRMVIFPMTAFRAMMKAVEQTFRQLRDTGTQAHFLDQLQTRQELYELLQYSQYTQFDAALAARFPER